MVTGASADFACLGFTQMLSLLEVHVGLQVLGLIFGYMSEANPKPQSGNQSNYPNSPLLSEA